MEELVISEEKLKSSAEEKGNLPVSSGKDNDDLKKEKEEISLEKKSPKGKGKKPTIFKSPSKDSKVMEIPPQPDVNNSDVKQSTLKIESKTSQDCKEFVFTVNLPTLPNLSEERTTLCILSLSTETQLEKKHFSVELKNHLNSSIQLAEAEELISHIFNITLNENCVYQENEMLKVIIPCLLPSKKDPSKVFSIKFEKEVGQWTSVKNVNQTTSPDHPNTYLLECELGLSNDITLAATSRHREDHGHFGIRGGRISSSTDGKVTISAKPHSFNTHTNTTLRVYNVDNAILTNFKSYHPEYTDLVSVSPLVCLGIDHSHTMPLTVTLPQLSKLKVDKKKINAMKKSHEDSNHATKLSVVIKSSSSAHWLCISAAIVEGKVDNADVLAFDLDVSASRILVLRLPENSHLESEVAMIANKMEEFLQKTMVRFVFRQQADNQSKAMIDCIKADDKETVVKFCENVGYGHGPDISNAISIKEGELVTIKFSEDIHRNNIQFVDKESSSLQFRYHSLLMGCTKFVQIEEIDKYAQKSRDVYRGYLQYIIESESKEGTFNSDNDNHEAGGIKLPHLTESSSDSRPPSKRSFKRLSRMFSSASLRSVSTTTKKSVILFEAPVTLPKPPPQDPVPLKKIAVEELIIKEEGVLDQYLLDNLSHSLGAEWKDLIYHLGVRRSKIEQIKRQYYNTSDNSLIVYEAILHWFKSTCKSTDKVGILCCALHHCGRDDLAQGILDRESKLRHLAKIRIEDYRLKSAFGMLVKSEEISSQWKDLAKLLKITDSEIEKIEAEHKDATDQCLMSCLQMWLQNQGQKATMKVLIKGLKRAKHIMIAESISNHFGLKK